MPSAASSQAWLQRPVGERTARKSTRSLLPWDINLGVRQLHFNSCLFPLSLIINLRIRKIVISQGCFMCPQQIKSQVSTAGLSREWSYVSREMDEGLHGWNCLFKKFFIYWLESQSDRKRRDKTDLPSTGLPPNGCKAQAWARSKWEVWNFPCESHG